MLENGLEKGLEGLLRRFNVGLVYKLGFGDIVPIEGEFVDEIGEL